MKKKYKKVYSISQEPGYRNYTVRDLIDLKGKKKINANTCCYPRGG